MNELTIEEVLNENEPQIYTRAPWYLSLAKDWYRKGHRKLPAVLLKPALMFGGLNRIVRYEISDQIHIDVPLERNMWDATDVKEYEHEMLDDFADRIRDMGPGVAFFDCGADIGLISMQLIKRCPNISTIRAFEPNPESFFYLHHNFTELNTSDVQALPFAVGNMNGRGTLVNPSYGDETGSHHAWYIEPDERGEISVSSVDSVITKQALKPQNIAIKIDVEGNELAVLQGAAQTLANADHFVVSFEAHRQVADRTGIDPMACVRELIEHGARDFHVSELPELTLDPTKDLFSQITSDKNVYNVICSK